MPTVQQYPAGIYAGKAGPLGQQRDFIAVIDGGVDGTGGSFYFARRASSSRGYDGLYGDLSVNLATLSARSATYYSTVDGKFVANGITISGTVTGASSGGSATARISGNYSDPVGTAASTGSLVPFTLEFRSDLYEKPATLDRIAGSYSGGGAFGGAWNLTVDSAGRASGNNGGCALSGTIKPQASGHDVYTTVLTLTGTSCARPGSTQVGWAVLDYTGDTKTGIWIFTTDSDSKQLNTFILNGVVGEDDEVPDPDTPQQAEGYWTSSGLNGVVAPNGSYFFYRRNGSGYDVLSGQLTKVDGSNGRVTDDAATFYSAAGTSASTSLSGTITSAGEFTGNFADPGASNAVTSFSMTRDSIYQASPATTAAVAGSVYESAPLSTPTMTVNVAADGVLSGTRDACTIVDSATNGGPVSKIGPYPGITTQNLYQVRLIFTGASCAGSEDGIAVAEYDAGGTTATGLRFFTLGTLTSSSQRFGRVVMLGRTGAVPPPAEEGGGN
ncbi:hypothetical protein GCM10023144_14910 [Pigmentiphaga soli]|uniref:Uncharacterized protein n=1 Tax=Pigmentiphaga soli TaxID=1007095 RepID=A0ABP8GRK7_9BURK